MESAFASRSCNLNSVLISGNCGSPPPYILVLGDLNCGIFFQTKNLACLAEENAKEQKNNMSK